MGLSHRCTAQVLECQRDRGPGWKTGRIDGIGQPGRQPQRPPCAKKDDNHAERRHRLFVDCTDAADAGELLGFAAFCVGVFFAAAGTGFSIFVLRI